MLQLIYMYSFLSW